VDRRLSAGWHGSIFPRSIPQREYTLMKAEREVSKATIEITIAPKKTNAGAGFAESFLTSSNETQPRT
jgi:hypothetical protein